MPHSSLYSLPILVFFIDSMPIEFSLYFQTKFDCIQSLCCYEFLVEKNLEMKITRRVFNILYL